MWADCELPLLERLAATTDTFMFAWIKYILTGYLQSYLFITSFFQLNWASVSPSFFHIFCLQRRDVNTLGRSVRLSGQRNAEAPLWLVSLTHLCGKQQNGECSALHDRKMGLREVRCLKWAWQWRVRMTFASLNAIKARGSVETFPALCKHSVNPGHANHCLENECAPKHFGEWHTRLGTASPPAGAPSAAVHVSSQRVFDDWIDAPTAVVTLCSSAVNISVCFDLCLRLFT